MTMNRKTSRAGTARGELGITLLELFVALLLIGVLGGIAISNIRAMTKPLTNAAFATEQFLQLTRSRAISGTEVFRVEPTSVSHVRVLRGATCATAATEVSDLVLELPTGAELLDTSWFVCFNARGRADASISFQVADADGRTKSLRIALGGGIKIQS